MEWDSIAPSIQQRGLEAAPQTEEFLMNSIESVKALRRLPTRSTGNEPIGNAELGQNSDDFTQIFRDIKLSNIDHMVFNVNYFAPTL